MSLLEARAIDTYYGRVQILHQLDLKVDPGEIVAIIGPNGAGKTTALKALFGLVPVKQGTVHHQGEAVTNATPEKMVRRGVCFVPQGRAVFPSLTVQENLRMGGFVLPDQELVPKRAEAVYERFPRLRERMRQPAGSLSGGEQQMLAMGRALMLEPEVLLLDEPSVGLAPQVVEEVLDAIVAVNEEGVAVVMVEQNAVLALETAHRAYLLVMGKNRLDGPGRQLLSDPAVRDIYLGGGAGDPDKMG
ncbi:MAG: ABC transporter ATP-binding protein [Thermoplasmatota archaeon]